MRRKPMGLLERACRTRMKGKVAIILSHWSLVQKPEGTLEGPRREERTRGGEGGGKAVWEGWAVDTKGRVYMESLA